ncbi:MAG: hypothetical protein ACYC7I_00260 [Gammaproteobacteria bacterium]
MFALSRKHVFNLSLGLWFGVCASSAFSQGLVNELYDLANTELILVSLTDGTSCSLHKSSTVSEQSVRISMALLAEAKARGRQVIMNCTSAGIAQITLL